MEWPLNSWKPPSLLQGKESYRFSVDAWILAAFAAHFPRRHQLWLESGSSGNASVHSFPPLEVFCDLGTGSGPVARGICSLLPEIRGYAIERDGQLFDFAQENLRGRPVSLIRGDLRFYPWKESLFDLVVCNPPYYEVGTGRVGKNPAVARARHTFHGCIADFAATLLCAMKMGGLFCFIYPADLAAKMVSRLEGLGLRAVGRLDICSFQDREPRLVCLALRRLPESSVTSVMVERLVLYQEHRVYTEEAQVFLDGFC